MPNKVVCKPKLGIKLWRVRGFLLKPQFICKDILYKAPIVKISSNM